MQTACNCRFLAGGDSPEAQERRNSTFKLIPRVTEGSWIVKQSVGTTPCLMGRKLHTRYHRCSLAPVLDAWPPPSVPADKCTWHWACMGPGVSPCVRWLRSQVATCWPCMSWLCN